MAGLSTTSAATEGFHLIKNNPAAIAVWGLVVAVATGAAIALIAATVGFAALSGFAEILAASQEGAEPDPATLLQAMTGMMSMVAIASLIFVIVDSVLVTAVKRAVLRPEERSAFYMRLGMDELRTFLVRFVRWLIMVVLQLLSIGLAFALGRAVHPLVGVLLGLAALPLLFYVWVKLSLAVSQSFAERRFNLFGSWRLTKGQFWPVVGAYLLAVIFYLIVYIVLSMIAGLAGGNAFMREIMENPENVDFSQFGPMFVTAILINIVAGIITKAFELPLLGAPPAHVYRELAMDQAE